MTPLLAEAKNIELLSALHVRVLVSKGRGHVGSAVGDGCFRKGGSRTVRCVGVMTAAMMRSKSTSRIPRCELRCSEGV